MKNIIIFGATSAIAQSLCRIYAQEKYNFYLIGKNEPHLKIISDDLKVRGASSTTCYTYDLSNLDNIHDLVQEIQLRAGKIDIALIAHGILPDQLKCEKNWQETERTIKVNALSFVAIIHELSNLFELQKQGVLIAISSVAGDRGRKSNYIYGASKSFVSTFMDGVRNRLSAYDIQVLTVKPGFVDTPLTASFKKGILWATPEKVALDIVNAVKKKKDKLYTPWFWSIIMLIIKNIPEVIFKKMKL